MRKRALRCSGLGLALLLQCLTLPSRALACVVGTGSGTCTQSALTACLPGGGSFDGTVTFNCGGAATITVASTKTINADTTIDGGGVVTISGGNSVSVFSVNTGVTFTVENLTIANGNNSAGDGGGIANGGFQGEGSPDTGGRVTVTNCTFSGNSAGVSGGAIFNYGGTLTVTKSSFSGNVAGAPLFGPGYGSGSGGAIFNYGGTLTVTDSTFSSNVVYSYGNVGNLFAGEGGAIANYDGGTLTVTDSTFSGNYTFSVYDDADLGYGGAIYNGYDDTLTVTDSTFSGNRAGEGGAINNYNNSGTVTVTNTIVANSQGGNCSGTITDGGHNIDDGTTCGFTGTGCSSTSGTSFCNTNPVLDPTGLKSNGGPTQTIALCTGTGAPSAGCTGASPAINAGDESVCSTTTGTAPVDNLDQRGFVRPGTGAANCSIGAFEANSPGLPPACTGDCSGDGQVTVNEIIVLVNIALGSADPTACAAGIPSGSQVNVALIIQAVNNALSGCGGGEGDGRLRFRGFDSSGITQVDKVGPTSADVDIQQDLCTDGTYEPFENARINANFLNVEAANIYINRVRIDFGPHSGLGANGVRDHDLGPTGVLIPGGRQAAVTGLMLIDVDDKYHISPDVIGQTTNVTITFFADDDADHSFQLTTYYDIVFANYDNCPSTTGGGGA